MLKHCIQPQNSFTTTLWLLKDCFNMHATVLTIPVLLPDNISVGIINSMSSKWYSLTNIHYISLLQHHKQIDILFSIRVKYWIWIHKTYKRHFIKLHSNTTDITIKSKKSNIILPLHILSNIATLCDICHFKEIYKDVKIYTISRCKLMLTQ